MFFEEMFGGMPHHMSSRNREPVDTDSLYNTLNVSKNSTEKEIKKAWRKICRTEHPDRGGDEKKFKEAENAYNILSDKNKRSLYDKGGVEAVKQGHDVSDLGSFFGHRGNRRQREEKPAPIKEIVSITLEEVCTAPTKNIKITVLTAKSRVTCNRCGGRGNVMETVRRGPMILQTQRECSSCKGKGVSFENEKKIEKNLEIFVPAGVKDGDKMVMSGDGHDLPGMSNGDVIVIFKVKPHKIFNRIQADLAIAKEITLVEALCGYSFTIRSVNGEDWLKIESKPGHVTQPSEVIKINGQGLPQKGNRNTRGNLFVRFCVVLPKHNSFTPKATKELKKLLKVKYDMPNQTQNDTRELVAGTKVRLVNLQNRPDLNGTEGKVMEANVRPGQFAVQLVTGQTVAVRAELLEITEVLVDDKTTNDKGPGKDDYVEEVTGEIVENMDAVSHTPAASGKGQHDEDEEEMGNNVGCRQM